MTTKRIQLSRAKGWRKPEGVVVVSRPSKWGNPFRVGDASPWGEHEPMTAKDAVEAYRYLLFGWEANAQVTAMARAELAGRDLACWCPLDAPCHADVLLEIAAVEPLTASTRSCDA